MNAALTNSPTITRQYDLSPDGLRFLVMKEGGGKIVVIENWFGELEQLVPTRPGTQR